MTKSSANEKQPRLSLLLLPPQRRWLAVADLQEGTVRCGWLQRLAGGSWKIMREGLLEQAACRYCSGSMLRIDSRDSSRPDSLQQPPGDTISSVAGGAMRW